MKCTIAQVLYEAGLLPYPASKTTRAVSSTSHTGKRQLWLDKAKMNVGSLISASDYHAHHNVISAALIDITLHYRLTWQSCFGQLVSSLSLLDANFMLLSM